MQTHMTQKPVQKHQTENCIGPLTHLRASAGEARSSWTSPWGLTPWWQSFLQCCSAELIPVLTGAILEFFLRPDDATNARGCAQLSVPHSPVPKPGLAGDRMITCPSAWPQQPQLGLTASQARRSPTPVRSHNRRVHAAHKGPPWRTCLPGPHRAYPT